MTKHIKVEWIEHKYIIPPEEYTHYPTQEHYDIYYGLCNVHPAQWPFGKQQDRCGP